MIRRTFFLSIFACCLFGISLTLTAQQKPIKPGQIQKPKAARQKRQSSHPPTATQAIKVTNEGCQQRITIGADALFGDEKWTITTEGEEVMAALGTMIEDAGEHPMTIEGHTDSEGSPASNLRLSETRAQAIKNWLVDHEVIPFKTPIKGYGGNKPVAPNKNPDGSDNPDGRERNRRIEIVIDTCQ